MTEAHRKYFASLLGGRMGPHPGESVPKGWVSAWSLPQHLLSLLPEAGLDAPRDAYVPSWAADLLQYHPKIVDRQRALRLRDSPWRTALVEALADPEKRKDMVEEAKALAMESEMARKGDQESES